LARVPAASVLVALGLLAALPALGGCGFRPLYGDASQPGSTGANLADIQISPIANRSGQMLRNNLLDRLTPRGTPRGARWRLDVALSESSEGVGILQNETITRVNYRLDANYQLVEVATGKPVLVRASRAIASYNVPSSEFATVVASKDAEARAIDEIADEIRTRLAIYFDQVALGTKNP
jgi:LPS-assembly lipoprotein